MQQGPFQPSGLCLFWPDHFALNEAGFGRLQMTDSSLASPDVVLTDRAARRIGRILGKEEPGTALRISVSGGFGVGGMQL